MLLQDARVQDLLVETPMTKTTSETKMDAKPRRTPRPSSFLCRGVSSFSAPFSKKAISPILLHNTERTRRIQIRTMGRMLSYVFIPVLTTTPCNRSYNKQAIGKARSVDKLSKPLHCHLVFHSQ